MSLARRIFKLKGVVQHYSWGAYHFIPQLLNIENKEQKPFAEYWLGAHPNHPALIQNEQEIPLDDFISSDAQNILGKNVSGTFSSLPYLLKVLDVRQMLSIQVHPSKASAEKGFWEENKNKIPVNASHRNYKDGNHKPELMVALNDFYLLHGFKEEKKLVTVLKATPELEFLIEIFKKKNYQGLYETVMLMPKEKVNEVLSALLQRIVPLYENGQLKKDSEDFWAAKAAINFCKNHNYDRGIFSIYFFNLLHLKSGEGIFQPAGLPHAYLEGQNVEVMANSDNVLRAGLTDKHIDVPELMKHVKFEATLPKILSYDSDVKTFASPAKEFELSEYRLHKASSSVIKTKTGEIFLVLNGSIEVLGEKAFLKMKKGNSFFVIAETSFEMKAIEDAHVFRVTVPGK